MRQKYPQGEGLELRITGLYSMSCVPSNPWMSGALKATVCGCVVVGWQLLELLFHQTAAVDSGGVSLLHTRKRSLPLKLAPKAQNKGTHEGDKGRIKALHKG